jgi:hypothetical protein
VGHGFAQHLRDCRFPVEMINVAMACESRPQLGENDPARRFANQKAQFYQTLADAFERDQVEGLSDETTIGQLAGILYEIDSQGRIRIESKQQARARGVLSPDRVEALMLALCKLPEKFEYCSIRDLPHMISGLGEAPDDEDDLPVGRRGRWDAWAAGSLARHLRRGG